MREWLISIRNKKKLTQKQVADAVDITRAYYTMIENGERNPSVDTAKKIAKRLVFNWTLFFENNSNETLTGEQQSTCKAS